MASDSSASTRLAHHAPSGVSSARSQPASERPTWAEVDLDAITANVARLKAHTGGKALMAVVKADGYGHGMLPSARAALAGGADWLAVMLVEEGRALREAGIDAPVLVLNEPPPSEAPSLLAHRLTPTVYTPAFVAALDAAASESAASEPAASEPAASESAASESAASESAASEPAASEPVAVHLKLDTGMRRVGVPPGDWEDAVRAVRDARRVRLEGLWSHYAVADEPDHPFISRQTEEFERGLALARRLGVEPEIAHLANSAGTLHLPESHHDMVRPGLAVYGLEPAPGLADGVGLRPALSWYTRLSLVKHLAAGEPVSYGLTWAPDEDTLLGTVPAGYADGVVRALGNTGAVVVGGRRAPMVGRVCMDQFCVDLGATEAARGDEVCLIGAQGDAAVTAEDWADWLGTINYEVVCGVGARVPRVYLGSA